MVASRSQPGEKIASFFKFFSNGRASETGISRFSSHGECSALRQEFGHDFAMVALGVRPAGCGADDQARVVTPAEAIAAGATHIVVGPPITEAEDRAAEARAILEQLVA